VASFVSAVSIMSSVAFLGIMVSRRRRRRLGNVVVTVD
jgi:hypothetical protein